MIKFLIEQDQQQEVARWCSIQCQGSYTVKPSSVKFSHIEDAEAFDEFLSGGLTQYEEGFLAGYDAAIMEVDG